MRGLIVAGLILACLSEAGATGASWPITPSVDYPAAETIGPAGGKAIVRVRVDDDASAIEVEVYGVDGMRAGDANKVEVHRDALRVGASFAFEVVIHPGSGRSALVVAAKARFAHAGAGGTLREFPFGEENAEQRRERSRCVRQDPEGVWIRELGCDEGSPQAPVAAAASGSRPPVLTVAEFRASPPAGPVARILGYVVESYLCPPCPKGAQCKPCFTRSAIFLADAPGHAPFALDAPPPDVVAIAASDPKAFELNVQYRVEFEVTARSGDRFDGSLLRSQRPDREPIWTD